MPQIIDLNKKPIKGERYFVDTNVWFWCTYVASKDIQLPNHPEQYQLLDYPRFLEKALNENSVLCHSPLTLAEISNIIEQTELELYREKIGNQHFARKDFRRIKDSRSEVIREISAAWATINSMSECVISNLDSKFAEEAISIMESSNLDPYDAFYIGIMNNNKIDCIISDDYDFCTYHNNIVITGNNKALK